MCHEISVNSCSFGCSSSKDFYFPGCMSSILFPMITFTSLNHISTADEALAPVNSTMSFEIFNNDKIVFTIFQEKD